MEPLGTHGHGHESKLTGIFLSSLSQGIVWHRTSGAPKTTPWYRKSEEKISWAHHVALPLWTSMTKGLLGLVLRRGFKWCGRRSGVVEGLTGLGNLRGDADL